MTEWAQLAKTDRDGVLPEGFHSTTNFPTDVCIEGHWVPVERIEMDCGIRVWKEGDTYRAEVCPMHHARAGDQLVVGFEGVRVHEESGPAEEQSEAFKFMSNAVSTERPKGRLIQQCAQAIKRSKRMGQKVLLVGGPAIIHCGCASVLADLIHEGWIDILFAGNALAAHDIESNMMGTSLGVHLESGANISHGHSHHLRAINRVRRAGSIRGAIEEGVLTGGVMHACVTKPIPFVLAGSIRDDGPLPDVITDAVAAQDAMRSLVPGVGTCLMVATTLHSVATGNMLPAAVMTFAVDSDADSVIKLTDRGTHQAVGIVTDCEFFLRELSRQLSLN